MDDCIQIGPNALFAAAVLSPAWANQYRQADSQARRQRSTGTASRVDGAGEEPSRAASGQGREQMELL
jgi:hypothetical protein